MERKRIVVRFILDGGYSDTASGYDFDERNSNDYVYVTFKSGQSSAIYRNDEGKIWERV